ncbi:hypothetical protein [Fodinibius sp. AD559]|uniref:hypothetical protein n=1 Tax=Fodinibius sp. AD559 TaxID=3424179 RepID=UPI00404704B7
MKLTKLLSFTALFALLIAFLTNCNTTGTNAEPGEGNVTLQFKTVSGSTTSKTVSSGNTTSSSHDSLLIEGTNGTLKIEDIRFIVAEFELDPSEADDDSTELEEFESQPFFVDLPLGEETLSLANSQIQAGLYEELEFEVENLDFENEEQGEDEEHQALADSIRSKFPDWPAKASMIITGTFTPTDGAPQSFKVFVDAEIEIERAFNPPLEVTEDNIEQMVSVRINPTTWFEQSDGSVMDLTQYDWDEHQQLLEFEAEFENGVEEIEVDDDFDDDDD